MVTGRHFRGTNGNNSIMQNPFSAAVMKLFELMRIQKSTSELMRQDRLLILLIILLFNYLLIINLYQLIQ